jgi:hypothetical protein
MSLFTNSNVTCPNCQTVVNMPAVGSVNADRRPDFRDAILNDTFQITTCPNCHEDFRLAPLFNYLDVGHGQWLAGLPAPRALDWPAVEDEIGGVFDASFGANVPAAAREVAELLTVRVCFGWPAIREKIYLNGAGLDDVTVEMMKLDLMRRLKSAPFVQGTELRVVQADEKGFRMVWIDSESQEVTQSFTAQRALYDAITAKPEAWTALRVKLTDGPFVDMQKLFLGQGRPAAAAAQ